MICRHSTLSTWLGAALTCAAFTFAPTAGAIVTEPNGVPVPLPLTEDLTGGATCCGVTNENMALQSLFNYLGDPIDWQADASLDPQVFSPLCGFTGLLLIRGGGCKVDFGWYNVDPANPLVVPPDPWIIPIITGDSLYNLGPNDAFWPRVPVGAPPCTDPPVCSAAAALTDAAKRWAPVKGVPLQDIRNNPNYKGGLVGFAVRANPADFCEQTKYSQHVLNQTCVNCSPQGPWISMLVYKSKRMPNSFYLAIEDLPTSPTAFDLPTKYIPGKGGGYKNDGDFNDFVYLVSGVTCEGGGTPCSTGSEGACGFGLTECDTAGNIICVPQFGEYPETCNNIDDDCNGKVDDGDNLCSGGAKCFRGTCVRPCSGGEFECPGGLSCDYETDICVDKACIGKECGEGQICIQGQCLGGCEGVQCPLGQACNLGRCVDPCQGRTCEAGKVCEGGICVENCSCRVCPENWTCDMATGQCRVAGWNTCSGGCAPNQVCIYGQCVGKCDGVKCPGGAACLDGVCGAPVEGWTPDPNARPNTDPYSVPIPLPSGPIPGVGGGGPGAGGGGQRLEGGDVDSGCGCRTTANGDPRSALALLGLGLLAFARRRRAA